MPKDVAAVSPFELNNRNTNACRPHDVGETRTSRGRSARQTSGRYDGAKALLLPTGLGRPVPSQNVRTKVGAVVDPMGNGLGRIQATINRNVDILELEMSHARISDGAYRTGRILQECFERLGGLGSTNWAGTDRKDTKLVSDSVAYRSVQAAQDITALMERVVSRIGMIDARLLRRVLGDRMTYAQCAEQQGKTGERGTGYVAMRFRDALESLTEAWTAKGAHQSGPSDKHHQAAETAVDRQRAAIAARAEAEQRRREASPNRG